MGDLARFWPERLSAHTDLRERLVARYADPRRGYHDLLHLEEVLERCTELLDGAGSHGAGGHGAGGHGAGGHGAQAGAEADSGADAEETPTDAVLLAAWFHDAVYDGTGDDEERSARLAEQELQGVGLDPELAAEVARLVRLTAHHRPADDDPAGQVLTDADLAILAADERRYGEYTAGVREEYAHVGDADFRRGRAAVLRDLLNKPALFHTAHARARWEAAARENVRRELAGLEPSD